MHPALAIAIAVLIAVAAFLVYVAVVGISFLGLGEAGEAALALTFFVVAAIIILIFAAGFKAQFTRVRTGKEALVGATGFVTRDLNPKGEIRVMSEFWEARTEDGAAAIAAGQEVKVLSMDGMTLVVKAAEHKA